ncbi:MAG TPA: flagellar M-ring protein FliF C-terminal domain-containing protein [Planctomycetota bacterium]
MQTFRDVLVQMKGIWSRLDGGQKLVVAAVLFATLSGLGGIAWFAARPDVEVRTAGPSATAAAEPDPDLEAGAGSSEFLRLQRLLGEQRTRLAQKRLDQMWPGKTSVTVNLELDATWETTTQKVLPEDAIVKSDKRDSSDSSGSRTADGGTKSEKREREFVTEIGERRSGRIAPEIRRLTVAVLYDRSLEQTAGFDKQQLTDAVKAIVGWDPARDQPEGFRTLAGDFAPVDAAAPGAAAVDAPARGVADVLLKWGPTVGSIAGVLVVVMFLRGLLRTARPAAKAAAAAAPAALDAANPSPEEQQARLRLEIERSIANDPAALARMLESWLTEQKA